MISLSDDLSGLPDRKCSACEICTSYLVAASVGPLDSDTGVLDVRQFTPIVTVAQIKRRDEHERNHYHADTNHGAPKFRHRATGTRRIKHFITPTRYTACKRFGEDGEERWHDGVNPVMVLVGLIKSCNPIYLIRNILYLLRVTEWFFKEDFQYYQFII